MMRSLILLGLVQTALFVFLVAKVVGIEKTTVREQIAGMHVEDRLISNLPDKLPQAWKHEIRNIFREEIELLSAQRELVEPASQTKATVRATRIDTRTDAEYRAETQEIMAQIEFYKGIGRISDSEMAELQLQMARLRPPDRSVALRALTKALGSGDLEGRF